MARPAHGSLSMAQTIPKVLSIAGSDSGGGAGIQADIKTLTSLHVYAMSVLTSVTSQNTCKVDAIHDLPAEFVEKQLRSVLSDIGADAIKTGMLSSAAIITTVAGTLRDYPDAARHLVVDPVMVSTSGSCLLAKEATTALVERLFPMTFILTPNVPEAEVLLDMELQSIKTMDDMHQAAKELGKLGPKYILLKGGHMPVELDEQKQVVDVLYNTATGQFHEYFHPFVDTKNTHGTGCTLSAAITAELAKGVDVISAIDAAIGYIHEAIATSLGNIGKGSGPVNHFHTIKRIPYTGTSFVEGLKNALPDGLWTKFIHHRFVQSIGDGTLPKENFIYYIKQDYLYLEHYARSAALAAYKAKDIETCARNAQIVLHIHKEMQMHLEYCKGWGISKEDIINTEESVSNVAYTRYVLDKGATGDLLDLQVAMAPCLLGYGEIGMSLYHDPKTKREGNPYWSWISNYAADDFQNAVKVGREILEELARHNVSTSQSRFKEVCRTFEQVVRLEIKFWDMGMQLQ